MLTEAIQSNSIKNKRCFIFLNICGTHFQNYSAKPDKHMPTKNIIAHGLEIVVINPYRKHFGK